VILGIEAGGRVHKHFYKLIDTFAKFKADADAGTLDNNTNPTAAKFHKTVFSRTKFSLMGRIQVARVKCVAERIMLITCPQPRRPDLDAIMQGGLWETYDNLLTYIREGRLTAAELVAEVGADPIFAFWVWERTRFATTATTTAT
jgi:hypothetical protein